MRIYWGLLIVILFGANACSTDLDLGANYEETTIVFGLLNPNDSIQYLKINKGYFTQNGDAVSLLENLDSIHFDTTTLEVVVDAYKDGNLISSYNFTAKTLGELALSNETPNHIVYQSKMDVDSENEYRLEIIHTNNGNQVTASTEIVQGEVELVTPRSSTTLSFRDDNFKNEQDFEWGVPEGSELFDLSLRFYYNEYSIEAINEFIIDFSSRNSDSYGNLTVAPSMEQYQVGETKYIDIDIFSNLANHDNDSRLSYNFTNANFYEGIAENLEATDLYRLPLYAEFIYTYSGSALSEYIRIGEARDGLVQASVSTAYTNIENGAGIFSSRTQSHVRRDFYNFWSEVKEFSIVVRPVYDTIDGVIDTSVVNDTTWLLEDTLIVNMTNPSTDLGVEFYPRAGSFSTLEELKENELTKDLGFIDF